MEVDVNRYKKAYDVISEMIASEHYSDEKEIESLYIVKYEIANLICDNLLDGQCICLD